MVEDRITDGKRIGQLLASEVTGLERGALGTLSVVDADPDVDPTPEGAFAFGIEADSTRLAEVHVTPETARLRLSGSVSVDAAREDVTVEESVDDTVVVAHSGAAVKALVDVLADRLR